MSSYSATILSLVQCVGQHPIIWDKDNVFYKNVKKTNDAWDEVAKELQLNKECCRRKWGHLRNAFLRMVTPDGKLNYNRIRLNATLYENMEFLLPIVVRKNAKDDNKENVNPKNGSKKISKLLTESKQENQNLIANTQELNEKFNEPILSYNFGVTEVFSHWPSTLCTPAIELNWTKQLETNVAKALSSSSQQNNEAHVSKAASLMEYPNRFDISSNLTGAPKIYNYEMIKLKQLAILDKTQQQKEEIFTESEIQEANSYFR